ncbi:hypothetical protein [Deinococcus humi]|uniref:Uncharacterized protein n=1 Tax=Deinococcus humi TaxID=662880 RepID=A0A7W8JUW5_9DEIO|nr:hypothetical protein [Deinococcus humi]MBB5363606.1 hypothetical protein [Deinococcus humi]GGO30063.1 hypothetical protein GCM10008949_24420 [Deinococcus humi]
MDTDREARTTSLDDLLPAIARRILTLRCWQMECEALAGERQWRRIHWQTLGRPSSPPLPPEEVPRCAPVASGLSVSPLARIEAMLPPGQAK